MTLCASPEPKARGQRGGPWPLCAYYRQALGETEARVVLWPRKGEATG